MKYLKLFENFRDDFYKSVKDLESKYNSDREKLFSQAKSKVDEFMFDLTDDFSYQNHRRYRDFIEDDGLSIWYFLKCDRADIDKFLQILSEIRDRLEEEMDLDIWIEMSGFKDGDETSLHEKIMNFPNFISYINYIKNSSNDNVNDQIYSFAGGKRNYRRIHQLYNDAEYFKFSVNII